MRARRFRLLAVPALTLALVAAAACSKKTTTTASPTSAPTFAAGTTMARLQAAGKMTVGTKFDQPLFGLKNPLTGAIEGFDVEIAKIIARKLFETRVLTCASPAYLERRGVPRTPHDLTHHECLLFRDPQTGRPFPWEFHRGKEIIEIAVTGRVMMDDPSAAVAACIAGQGVFQSLEIGLRAWFASGELVHILPDWSNERWPLYALYPSRRFVPAKLQAFLDFCTAALQTRVPQSQKPQSKEPHVDSQ